MADIPLEAGDLQRFTPPSLANLPIPPVFLLRAGGRRDRTRYQKMLLQEGLRQHSLDRQRAETLRGLQNLWSAEDYAAYEGRIKGFWDALDQWSAANKNNPTPDRFEHPDTVAISDLIMRVTDAWEPLRSIAADNMVFAAESPSVLLSVSLAGWEGVAMAYRREAGIAPLDLLEDLEETLTELEREHASVAEVGLPGTAYLQLCGEAGKRLFLSKEQEKNSSSPPPSSPTPPDSKMAGKGLDPGSSTAPASSKPIRARRSRKKTSS